MSEQEREGTSPGATRSQHVVLMGPADVRIMTAAMRPCVERSRDGGAPSAPLCLVITPTVEQAFTAADQARHILGDDTVRVVPVTGATRGKRVLAAAPVAVATGSAADLLALRRDAALQLDALQGVVIIGLDDQLAAHAEEALLALLADVPDLASRVATIEQETPEVEAFLEAQLRKARHIEPTPVGSEALPVTPRFLVTSVSGRADALRGVLDEIDPPSLVVVAATAQGEQSAHEALARLGVPVDGLNVQVVRQATSQHVAMTVLWEAPATYDALVDALAMRPVEAVALLLPDDLPAFRRLTSGTAEAWTPAAKKASAMDRVGQLRQAVRSTLINGGATASELALLAPLLETHDAMEIACAALRLLEGARRDVAAVKSRASAAWAKPAQPHTPAARPELRSETAGAPSGVRQKVFLGIGKRDGARVGDIVGAIANEANIPGDRIGRVDMFESHTLVELSAEDAATAVTALGSAMLQGRRLNARIDERGDRPERGDGPRRSFGGGGGGFGGRGGDRGGDRGGRGGFGGGGRGGDRPARSFDRGDRGDRGERSGGGERSFGGDRGGERGGRSGGFDRGPRTFDRGDRGGERGGDRGAPRSFDRGDRGGERGGDRGAPRGFDRGDRNERSGGGDRGGFRPQRTDDARREFGDRSPRERTEPRTEWAERADRMKHAKRGPRRDGAE